MADEEKKDPFAPQNLQETDLHNALKQFGTAFGSDLQAAANQVNYASPPVGMAFNVLSTHPMNLGSHMEFVKSMVLTSRRGAMAMHLRREAQLQYLREGREEILREAERDIEALSPYNGNDTVEVGDLTAYLTFLFPFLCKHWQIKRLNKDLQTERVLNLSTFRFPGEGELQCQESPEGYVEFGYTSAEGKPGKRTLAYSLTMIIRRSPPFPYVNHQHSSVSLSTLRFTLKRREDEPFFNHISSSDGVAVYNALERESYKGGNRNVDVESFQRIIRAFFENGSFGAWNLDLMQGANQWLIGDGAPPVHMILQSGYETLPASWKEGDEIPDLLEHNKTAQEVFFHPSARGMGLDMPTVLLGGYPLLGIDRAGDLPLMAVSQYRGHRLAYGEWSLTKASDTSVDEAPAVTSTNFMLVVDRCILIVGERRNRSPYEGYWKWTVKGKVDDDYEWKTIAVTPPTYTLLFECLKVARDGYVRSWIDSPAWDLIQQKVNARAWGSANDDNSLVNRLRKQGFVDIAEELHTHDFGNYLGKVFDIDIDVR